MPAHPLGSARHVEGVHGDGAALFGVELLPGGVRGEGAEWLGDDRGERLGGVGKAVLLQSVRTLSYHRATSVEEGVAGMTDERWTRAELIPTAGIKGAEEQERRATSALLAVMSAVDEFGRVITKSMGAPAGSIDTYIEVPFEANGKRCTPDGLIHVARGKRSWTALVESKTGNDHLQSDQIETYLDVARQEGLDAVVTISNEIPPLPGTHPTPVDGRKLRGPVSLHHLSWVMILTEAVVQKLHRGVADPDQAWILGELIRYLEHPRSGVVEFEEMGDSWVSVRDAVRAGTLRANDKGAAEVAGRWDQLVRYACLRLGRELGADVQVDVSRRELGDRAFRAQRVRAALEKHGVLDGGLRIPDTVGPVSIRADLRARQVVASVEIDAPRKGKARTRVNWLLRQLDDAPPHLRIDAYVSHGRGASTSELLGTLRENPDLLVADPKKELKSFTVAMFAPMGTKRGQGRGSFVGSVLDLIDAFYAAVVQNLKEWTAPPPKLKTKEPAMEPLAASDETSTLQPSQEAADSRGDADPAAPETTRTAPPSGPMSEPSWEFEHDEGLQRERADSTQLRPGELSDSN